MSTSYDHYIHTLLEPNDILRTGKYKRDKELPGWMLKAGHLTQEEMDKINHEHEQQQDEYLKKYGV